MKAKAPSNLARQLRGAGRLAVSATTGITDIVEAMHGSVARLPLTAPKAQTRGITGLVYRSVRGVTSLVGGGVDLALQALTPLMRETDGKPTPAPTPKGQAVLAALNGVFGDYLADTDNPLAIAMQLRDADGVPLQAAPAGAGPRPLLLIHGLCMNDLQWQAGGFAPALAALGYTPLYLHYNSGRHISDNGRELAELLEQLVKVWPTELQDITLLGHSMGGLLARSAIHHATLAKLRWPKKLKQLVTLGTPHFGAPLERGGQQLQNLLGWSSYSRPIVALTQRRSAGIQDLRHASLTEADWGRASTLALPVRVACYAVAAITAKDGESLSANTLGDGLVPLNSALGRHREAGRSLAFAPERQWMIPGTGHLALLTDPAVLAKLKEWLSPR